ncbi:MAG: FG-GAP-like repeat-containing protein [Thermodesulfobacteriota bacterium]|nr:FG-GAP-like repeat-containing protein [Thermodesulfobacteriota bacterium]
MPVESLGAVQPSKVLILPFKMNTPQNMTYLQQGIMDMLSSRLAWEKKVVVVPKVQARQVFESAQGRIDEPTARKLGQGLGADYVLFGSVTVLGQGVSLDASMLDLKNKKAPVTVFGQSQGMDSVIPKVNAFAQDINEKIFGRNIETRAARPKPKPQGPLPAHRRHPDYLLSGISGQSVSAVNPNFIASPGAGNEGGFWRSPSFPMAIVGMDVGDVDGDGKNEVVYASPTAVYVARLENGVFRRLAKYDGYKSDRYLTLDIADIDGNGRPEIFVSNQRNFAARSLVLEFKGGRLVVKVKDSPWYLRVVHLTSGRKLFGQYGGMRGLFYGGVHEMKFSGGKYVSKKSLALPKDVNVFNFTMITLKGSAKEKLVVIDDDEHMMVLSRGGQRLWKGNEYFAGTLNYLSIASGTKEDWEQSRDNKVPVRVYIPSRILVTDLNEDGKKEVIVSRNESSNARWLERWRGFKSGSIYSLSFSQMAFRQNWRSRNLPGCLADYHIADYDNDGKRDLIVAVITKAGDGIMSSRSTIVGYELASPEELRKAEAEREK